MKGNHLLAIMSSVLADCTPPVLHLYSFWPQAMRLYMLHTVPPPYCCLKDTLLSSVGYSSAIASPAAAGISNFFVCLLALRSSTLLGAGSFQHLPCVWLQASTPSLQHWLACYPAPPLPRTMVSSLCPAAQVATLAFRVASGSSCLACWPSLERSGHQCRECCGMSLDLHSCLPERHSKAPLLDRNTLCLHAHDASAGLV